MFWILLKQLEKRLLDSSRLQHLKNYLCMFFRFGEIGRRQWIKKNHYVIIDSFSAYFMLNFIRRYLKKFMRYFNLKSDLNSAHQGASNGVHIFVISWKNIFWILLKKLAKRLLYSSRLEQLKYYLCI